MQADTAVIDDLAVAYAVKIVSKQQSGFRRIRSLGERSRHNRPISHISFEAFQFIYEFLFLAGIFGLFGQINHLVRIIFQIIQLIYVVYVKTSDEIFIDSKTGQQGMSVSLLLAPVFVLFFCSL